jgi:hypothetical protein
LLPHNWDPQNVQIPKAVRIAEEVVVWTVGATRSDRNEFPREKGWPTSRTNDGGTSEGTVGAPMVYSIGDLS